MAEEAPPGLSEFETDQFHVMTISPQHQDSNRTQYLLINFSTGLLLRN